MACWFFYDTELAPRLLKKCLDWAPFEGLYISGEAEYDRYVVERVKKPDDLKLRIGLRHYRADDGIWRAAGWVRRPRPFDPGDYERISRFEEILRSQGRQLTEEAIKRQLEAKEPTTLEPPHLPSPELQRELVM